MGSATTFRMRGALAAGVALVLGALSLAGPARAETTIRIGIVAPGPTYWPLYVGKELGYFKGDGLNLQVYNSGGSTAQQLVVNAVDIGCSGFPDFMRASYRGAPVKIFASSVRTPPYGVFAKPSIKSAADLKGKTISIGGVQDVTLIYVGSLLKSVGLTPKDVDFVYAKSANDRFTALVGGAVDAAILNPPSSFKALALNFRNVGDIGSTMKDFPFTVWADNTNWRARNKKALDSFSRDYFKATRWLYDPANQKQAIAFLRKDTKISAKDAQSSYDYLVKKLQAYSKDGTIGEGAFSQMTDALLQLGDIKKPVPAKSVFYEKAD